MAIENSEPVQVKDDAGYFNEVEISNQIVRCAVDMQRVESEKEQAQAKVNEKKNELKQLRIEQRGLLDQLSSGTVQGVLPLDTTAAQLPVDTVTLDDAALAALADDDEDDEPEEEGDPDINEEEADWDTEPNADGDEQSSDTTDNLLQFPPSPVLDLRGKILGLIHDADGKTDTEIALLMECSPETVASIRAGIGLVS